MTLTEAQKARVTQLLDAGVPERYEGMPDSDALLIIRVMHNCGEAEAWEILLIERGEIDGDVVEDEVEPT